MKYKTTIDLIHVYIYHIFYLFDTITFGPKSFCVNQSSLVYTAQSTILWQHFGGKSMDQLAQTAPH